MPTGKRRGGTVPGTGTTDTVRARLTPGEHVVAKAPATKHRKLLNALNRGEGPTRYRST